jgi:hypothetical protein
MLPICNKKFCRFPMMCDWYTGIHQFWKNLYQRFDRRVCVMWFWWQQLSFCGECLMQQFDNMYGPGWQCVAGTSFGSGITHLFGCFIHFCVGPLAIMLFRGAS